MAFVLAVCAEMLWPEKPIEWRSAGLDALGFEMGLWNWPDHDPAKLKASSARFSIMNGYREGRQTVEIRIPLGVARLNLHETMSGDGGRPVLAEIASPLKWVRARDTLHRSCDLAEELGVVFTLENLNLPIDHAGLSFARTKETLVLVAAADRPELRLNLDLYHAQIGEGNLIELCQAALHWIGEIQVADVTGRCEPGTGEIDYHGVVRAIDAMRYAGPVGMEAFASGDPEAALDAFRQAFTA